MRKSFANSFAATFMAANICLASPAFADDLQTYNLLPRSVKASVM